MIGVRINKKGSFIILQFSQDWWQHWHHKDGHDHLPRLWEGPGGSTRCQIWCHLWRSHKCLLQRQQGRHPGRVPDHGHRLLLWRGQVVMTYFKNSIVRYKFSTIVSIWSNLISLFVTIHCRCNKDLPDLPFPEPPTPPTQNPPKTCYNCGYMCTDIVSSNKYHDSSFSHVLYLNWFFSQQPNEDCIPKPHGPGSDIPFCSDHASMESMTKKCGGGDECCGSLVEYLQMWVGTFKLYCNIKTISNFKFTEPTLPQTRRPQTSWPSTAARRILPGRCMSSLTSSVTATTTHATISVPHLQRLASVMRTGRHKKNMKFYNFPNFSRQV